METLKKVVIPRLVELTKSNKLKWRHHFGSSNPIVYLGGWRLTFELARDGKPDLLEFSNPDYSEEEYNGRDDEDASPWLRWIDDLVLLPLRDAIIDQLKKVEEAPIVKKEEPALPIPSAIDSILKSLERFG